MHIIDMCLHRLPQSLGPLPPVPKRQGPDTTGSGMAGPHTGGHLLPPAARHPPLTSFRLNPIQCTPEHSLHALPCRLRLLPAEPYRRSRLAAQLHAAQQHCCIRSRGGWAAKAQGLLLQSSSNAVRPYAAPHCWLVSGDRQARIADC